MKHTLGSRLLSLLLVLTLCAALSPAALAAEGFDTGTPVLQSVSVTPETAALKVGETQVLTAAVTLSDGSAVLPEGTTVDWEVANGREDEVSVTPASPNALTATVEALAVPKTTA